MSCVSAPLKFTLLQTPNSIDDDIQPPPIVRVRRRGRGPPRCLRVRGCSRCLPGCCRGAGGVGANTDRDDVNGAAAGPQAARAQRPAASWPPVRDGSATQRRSVASSLGRSAARPSTSRGAGVSMGRSVAPAGVHSGAIGACGLLARWIEEMDVSAAAAARSSNRCRNGQRFGGGPRERTRGARGGRWFGQQDCAAPCRTLPHRTRSGRSMPARAAAATDEGKNDLCAAA